MTKEHTPEEIKNRLSNIGEAIGNIAIKYIAVLEKRCANYEMTISKMENGTCGICKETEKDNKIVELQRENEELKNRDCWKSCEYANPKSEWIGQHIKDVQNLTKAKELIKRLIKETYGEGWTIHCKLKLKQNSF